MHFYHLSSSSYSAIVHQKEWQRLLQYIASTAEVEVDSSKYNFCSYSTERMLFAPFQLLGLQMQMEKLYPYSEWWHLVF